MGYPVPFFTFSPSPYSPFRNKISSYRTVYSAMTFYIGKLKANVKFLHHERLLCVFGFSNEYGMCLSSQNIFIMSNSNIVLHLFFSRFHCHRFDVNIEIWGILESVGRRFLSSLRSDKCECFFFFFCVLRFDFTEDACLVCLNQINFSPLTFSMVL